MVHVLLETGISDLQRLYLQQLTALHSPANLALSIYTLWLLFFVVAGQVNVIPCVTSFIGNWVTTLHTLDLIHGQRSTIVGGSVYLSVCIWCAYAKCTYLDAHTETYTRTHYHHTHTHTHTRTHTHWSHSTQQCTRRHRSMLLHQWMR